MRIYLSGPMKGYRDLPELLRCGPYMRDACQTRETMAQAADLIVRPRGQRGVMAELHEKAAAVLDDFKHDRDDANGAVPVQVFFNGYKRRLHGIRKKGPDRCRVA